MGCEYIKGEHVEKDDLQAEEWLRKAVDGYALGERRG